MRVRRVRDRTDRSRSVGCGCGGWFLLIAVGIGLAAAVLGEPTNDVSSQAQESRPAAVMPLVPSPTQPASPTLAPLPTPPPLDTDEIADRVFVLTNEARVEHGMAALELERDTALDLIASRHSSRMAVFHFFSHYDYEMGGVGDRARASGYSCRKLSENIARYPRVLGWVGSSSNMRPKGWKNEDALAREVVKGWMSSPGHRLNMLDTAHERIGIGVAVRVEHTQALPDESVLMTQVFCGS